MGAVLLSPCQPIEWKSELAVLEQWTRDYLSEYFIWFCLYLKLEMIEPDKSKSQNKKMRNVFFLLFAFTSGIYSPDSAYCPVDVRSTSWDIKDIIIGILKVNFWVCLIWDEWHQVKCKAMIRDSVQRYDDGLSHKKSQGLQTSLQTWFIWYILDHFGDVYWRDLGSSRDFQIHSVKILQFDSWKALWGKSRQAKIKYIQFRKRSNLDPTNDELGLDNIFANYEDKTWWWIIFLRLWQYPFR